MHSPGQKRTLRSLAAAILLIWAMAQVACFLHCHYPGNFISDAHSVSAERKCCSTQQTKSHSQDAANGGKATCIAFKNVALGGKHAIHTPPDLSFCLWAVAVSVELQKTAPDQSLRLVPITDSSPPLVALLKPPLLNLPPPSLA